MLDLSNVTLVSIDSVADHYSKSNIRLAAISRIVPKLLKEIKFGDILMINPFGKNKELLNEDFVPHWKDFPLNKSPKNIAWLNNYLIKKLPHLIKTEWYLIIQWDGFPTNTEQWSDKFFEYHFLGGGHSVFNGGFSLRNTNTMRIISEVDDTFGLGAEDGFYSCFLDNKWTKNKNTPFKIKWAQEDIVNKFCSWDLSKISQYGDAFGWHRYDRLSKSYIKSRFSSLSIFSDNEIVKLVSYCLLKEIEFKFYETTPIKLFDMEYNEDFFDNY